MTVARGEIPPFIRRVLGRFTPRRFSYAELVRVGPRRFLLAHSEDVRHVLLTNAANYVKTPRLTGPRGRRRAGEGVLTRTGESHRERKRLLLPIFHRAAVTRFGPAIAARLEAWFERRVPGERLDLAAEMAGLTRSAILSILFDDLLEPAELRRVAAAVGVRRRFTEWLYHGKLPLRDRLPTPLARAHHRAVGEIDAAIREAIDRRRAGGGAEGSLVEALLTARGPDGRGLADLDVRDEVLTFTSTGYETLGEALTWTWYLLARHEGVEAELHAELDGLLGRRPAAAPDVPRLDLAGRLFDEVLRLYPPTWIYARIPIRADRLPSGGRVPARATLYVCPYLLHRHPEHFPDPERFDPDRFVHGRRPGRFLYLPFGDGPHRCLGESLARLEGLLATARIGQRLRFRLVDPRPAEPHGGITLTPAGGLEVEVLVR